LAQAVSFRIAQSNEKVNVIVKNLINKASDIFKSRGLHGLLCECVKFFKRSTLGKLDFYIFNKRAWLFIRVWMLNKWFYHALKILGFREGEHQIGRLMNMRQIFSDLHQNGVHGDIVEFGSYRGFSLFWLAKLRDIYRLHCRIIGIDSFDGLPETSTVWKKGEFGDTSYDLAQRNIKNALKVENLEDAGIYILKGLFNDENIQAQLHSLAGEIILAHVDCDLGSSCDCALKILNKMKVKNNLYLMFDDWGNHPEEIPESFARFTVANNGFAKFGIVSETRFTRYYKITL